MKKKLWLVSTTVLAGLALGITSVSADTNVSTNSSNMNGTTVATTNNVNICILQVKSAEKCNDFLHSLAAHFLFYLVI